MKKSLIIITAILGSFTSVFAQKFDLTSGKKMYLDHSVYEGAWVSKKNPNDLKVHISFKTKHIKNKIEDFSADYFILTFLKFKENGIDLTKQYAKMESSPMLKEGVVQRVTFVDPRSKMILYYEFKPWGEDGKDLLLTPIPPHITFDEPQGPYLFEPRKAIVLTRVKE